MTDRLIKLFNIVFFGVFYYLLILSIGKMNLQSPISAVLLLPIYLWGLKQLRRMRKDRFIHKKAIYLIQGVSCAAMLLTAYWLNVRVGWDWGRILLTAHHYVITGKIDQPEYFMRYPNNQFWLVCLIGIFNIVKKCTTSTDFRIYKAVSILVNILVIQSTIFFIYRTAKRLWNERKALFVGLAAALCLPFYLYSVIFYNDIGAGFISIMLIYCDVRLHQENDTKKKVFLAACIGILGGAAFHVKILVFIVLIAIVIGIIFRNRVKLAVILLGVLLLSLVGTHILLAASTDHILHFDAEESVRWEFPPTHWLMMALNVNGAGGYNREDDYFTRGFDTYEEKKEQNLVKIKERLSERGAVKTVKHILYTKQVRTWANSCLAGDDYAGRNPIHEHCFLQELLTCNGKWHWVCLIYSWIYHVTLIFGTVLSGCMAIKKKCSDQSLLSGRIAIFGLFLFLSIWECNSRYVYSFLPVMILTSSDGLVRMFEWLDRKWGMYCEKYCSWNKSEHKI